MATFNPVPEVWQSPLIFSARPPRPPQVPRPQPSHPSDSAHSNPFTSTADPVHQPPWPCASSREVHPGPAGGSRRPPPGLAGVRRLHASASVLCPPWTPAPHPLLSRARDPAHSSRRRPAPSLPARCAAAGRCATERDSSRSSPPDASRRHRWLRDVLSCLLSHFLWPGKHRSTTIVMGPSPPANSTAGSHLPARSRPR
jgi:hypothetical protein